MIKTQKLVPEVYYNKSRDFQSIGRVFDIAFNYMHSTVDSLTNFSTIDYTDISSLSPLANTLGFKEKHDYDRNQLRALCSAFMLLMKNKGTIESINLLLKLLSNVENISEEFVANIDPNNSAILRIYVPLTLKDLSLFYDVLDYILPAGMSCEVIRSQLVVEEIESNFTTGVTVSVLKDAEAEGGTAAYNKAQVARYTSDKVSIDDIYGLPAALGNITVVSYNEDLLEKIIQDDEIIEEDEVTD